MKFKVIVSLSLLALLGNVSQSNAMYRSTLNKVAGAKIASTFACLPQVSRLGVNTLKSINNRIGSYAKPLQSFFYGAVIMQNPKTEKTIVLLSDLHLPSKVSKDQQEEVIALVKKLEERGQSVHVLVEDISATDMDILKEMEREKGKGQEEIDKKMLFFDRNFPLTLIGQRCEENNVYCTNIDIRTLKNGKSFLDPSLQKEIEYFTDKNVMDKLHSYYIPLLPGATAHFLKHVDANILNNIEKKGVASDTAIVIVCAGGLHTTSVSKILYQQGYCNTQIKVSPISDKSEFIKDTIYNFNNEKPLPENTEGLKYIRPLANIQETVLGCLHELKVQKQQKRDLKRLHSYAYQSYNQF